MLTQPGSAGGPGQGTTAAMKACYGIPVSCRLIRQQGSYASVQIGVWVLRLARISHHSRRSRLQRRRCSVQFTEPGLYGRRRGSRTYRGGNRRGVEAGIDAIPCLNGHGAPL